ncbi:MAG: hypothetical protein AAF667_19200 [Pseudomonadota bacterium]
MARSTRGSRGRGKDARPAIKINLEGRGKADAEVPVLVLQAISPQGATIFSAQVDDDQVEFPDGVLEKAAEIRLTAADDEACDAEPLRYRAAAFTSVLERGAINVAQPIWRGWLSLLRCVTGRVQVCRRSPWWYRELAVAAAPSAAEFRPAARASLNLRATLSAASALAVNSVTPGLAATQARPLFPNFDIDDLIAWPSRCFPVCQGRVEVWRRICCCDPWIVYDPRLPGLLDELEDLIRPVPLPDPIPDPGPIIAPLPVPVPNDGPVPTPIALPPSNGIPAEVQTLIPEGALDERALRAAQDLQALRRLEPEAQADYVNARPYLYCPRVDCGTPVKVAEGEIGPDGRFNVCWSAFPQILRAGCHEEFAYIVRQPFGPFSLTIYNGITAGHWYDADDTPTLTSYHPLARGCRVNPATATTYLDIVGDTGSYELITPDAKSAVAVNGTAYNSGLVFPAPNPAAALGANLNRNWGGILKLNYMFGEAMQDAGAKFYRISVSEADSNGDPVGAPVPVIDVPAWTKDVPAPGGGTETVAVSLGPNSVGGQNNLFEIPYDTNPTTDWNAGQYHARLDTRLAQWSNPDVRHLVMLEVFDENGRRLRPQGTPATGLPGTEIAAPFRFERRVAELGPKDNVPFGALTHMFWWDNRDVECEIEDMRLNGATFNAECLFFGGTSASTFSVGYRAYHPNEQFQLYHNLWWLRGLGNTSNPTGSLESQNPSNVGVPPGDPGGSTANSFGEMLLPFQVPTGDPPRTKCAFAINLGIANKRTDGDSLGNATKSDVAAVVIEINT